MPPITTLIIVGLRYLAFSLTLTSGRIFLCREL